MLGPLATKGAMLEWPLFASAEIRFCAKISGQSDQLLHGHKFKGTEQPHYPTPS
jgi:hypothetical protein